MKLKSLFLASLAAMAMVSCSNEDDQIVNGGSVNAAKDAALQFTIGFPQVTRAVVQEDENNGETYEQKVNAISFVLKYNDGTPTAVYDFVNDEDPNTPGFTQTDLLIKTEKVEVSSGEAEIFVYVNPVTKVTTGNYATLQETANYTNMDDLGNIANPTDAKFLMFGKGTCTIAAGKDANEASVNVSRVAAKLAEQTAKDKIFDIENSVVDFGKAMKVKITDYTYVNLNKTTNVTNNATIFTPADATTGYFQYFVQSNNYKTFDGLIAKNMNAEQTNKVTYCLENNNANTPTMILYKAAITEFPGYTAGDNFYIDADGILYPSFDVMNDKDGKFHGQLTNEKLYSDADGKALNDNSTYNDFNKYGIQKYEAGVCYYRAEIKTGADTKIVHNNYYKLSVSKITKLGDPGTIIPTPGTPLTYLTLNITVQPWIVWSNDFEL